VHKLLDVLQRLVSLGNTVIVIEHNLDVIKSADHIIDLGPEGGVGGGRVVASGTPEEVAKVKKSHTGQALRPLLNGHAANGNGHKQAAEAKEAGGGARSGKGPNGKAAPKGGRKNAA
jgi:excinuclease ABC subunit A